jgi:phosphoesterase RecJ-like protein
MINKKKETLLELLVSADTIGLMTHKDGDGDAFGSMLGLERGLKLLGKKTVIFSNEKLSRIFEFLNEKIEYEPEEEYKDMDLLIGLDANSIKRFTIPEIMESAKDRGVRIAIIDHHMAGDIETIADCYLKADEESCTSEMVFDILADLKVKIDKVTASIILLGIETDTFSMQFVNTKPKTFEVVAELLRRGARLKPIVESAFGGRPISTVKLLGRVMNRLTLDKKNGLVKSFITKKDASELQLETEASSGVANFIEQVEGAKIVAVFEERPEGIVKVSLRSNNSNVDVEKIAKSLGGGGHKKAAGFECEGTLQNAMADVESEIAK